MRQLNRAEIEGAKEIATELAETGNCLLISCNGLYGRYKGKKCPLGGMDCCDIESVKKAAREFLELVNQ